MASKPMPNPPDWAIAHVVRTMAASGMQANSLTDCMQGYQLLCAAQKHADAVAAQPPAVRRGNPGTPPPLGTAV